jgi:hypothetical protein
LKSLQIVPPKVPDDHVACGLLDHRRNKAIADRRHRLDEARLAPVVSPLLSQKCNGKRQGCLVDEINTSSGLKARR